MHMISFRRRGRLLVTVIGCALLVSACASGPDFVAPQPPRTQKYTIEGDDNLTGAQRIVHGQKPMKEWWRAFRSPALDQVMARALTDNNDLAATRARLARAREQVDAVAGALWPQVSLDAVAGRQKYGVALFGPSDITIPPFTYYTLGPQVTYLLDFAGGERRAVEEQKALAEYQTYQFDAFRLSLTGNVMAQALGIASAKAQLAVMEDIIANDRMNVDLVQIARNIGSATLVDVLSAQSQLAGDQALLPSLRQQLSIAEHALAILVGKAPADWHTPAFELSAFSLPSDLPLSLPSELVRARPDIRASEKQLHAATAAIGVATANLYPSITLTANTLQESLTLGNLFNASANTWAFAAGLTAPIFNGGALRAKKRAAEDAYLAALADYKQVILESFGQVADVLKALEHDAEQIDAQQHALETAQSSLKLARLSYRAGNIGILQVLDAERLFNQARLGLTRSHVQRYQDTALLYLALGGGSFSTTQLPGGN
jgi:NodT family efflux transporter outer membrane factor (OMF) lipoprotein